MEYEDFRNNIKKVSKHRKHSVTNSWGVYDAWKYIRRNKWLNLPRKVTQGEFYKIIRKVNLLLAQKLIDTGEVTFPDRMGTIEIRKRPTSLSIVDGELKISYPIDWDATLKLWFDDPQARIDKQLVRIETDEVFRVYYNKKNANYDNKTFYEFTPTRDLKNELKRFARAGRLEGFLMKY